MSVNFLLIVFVLIVIAMIAIVLVQKGTGAAAGSAFGSGASSTVFGAKGSGNFLTKSTMMLAFLFFAISMLMAVNASKEFSTASTGEVDLGVIGKLDTTTSSDVPQIGPTDNDTAIDDATTENDIPVVDTVPSQVPAVPTTTNNGENTTEDKANELKDITTEKVESLQPEAIEKVEEVKDSVDG
ncbi:MAG: preprotein translocase subunit SecG [Proteobacteria bacterium]|nr:preprotein translocase subunit SecG [Pseudomonadota bacterium]